MAESFLDYEEMLRQALIRLVKADKAAVSGVGGAIDAGVQAATSDTAPWWLNEAADAFQGGAGWLNSQVDIPKTVEATVGIVTDTSEERAARQKKAIVEAQRNPKYTPAWGKGGMPEGYIPFKKPDDDDDDDDYLNQLMMAALMADKKGKMGQLAGAAGGGISFGDSWSMRAPWEKDYRYL